MIVDGCLSGPSNGGGIRVCLDPIWCANCAILYDNLESYLIVFSIVY